MHPAKTAPIRRYKKAFIVLTFCFLYACSRHAAMTWLSPHHFYADIIAFLITKDAEIRRRIFSRVERAETCRMAANRFCFLPCRSVETCISHLSPKRCALLTQEACTSFLRAYNPPANRLAQPPTPLLRNAASFVAQGSIFCCAREHLLLRNKIGTPPNLQISQLRKYQPLVG